jgi:hypothetical protein
MAPLSRLTTLAGTMTDEEIRGFLGALGELMDKKRKAK